MEVKVYVVTATSSVMAYLWLMFILMFSSKDVCEATPLLTLIGSIATSTLTSLGARAIRPPMRYSGVGIGGWGEGAIPANRFVSCHASVRLVW